MGWDSERDVLPTCYVCDPKPGDLQAAGFRSVLRQTREKNLRTEVMQSSGVTTNQG